MKNSKFLILAQFFLIIFVYHILKDLKDTVVITASDAGAEVIPFLKIWGMLPLALATSYFFARCYHYLGRKKTLYLFVTILLCSYALFAFCLYPLREQLFLSKLSSQLKIMLPIGCKGLIAMVCYWMYTLFYISAELWSLIVLTILFWGYVNETTSFNQAKNFYPLCMFVGNCAGILSGQTSRFLCHTLSQQISWQLTLQIMIGMVIACGIAIMFINQRLSQGEIKLKEAAAPFSFKECLSTVFQSQKLLWIAFIVVGYALASNLIEVVWKNSVKSLHPTPQAYNAYINQLTSLIGLLAVLMAFASRWIFLRFSWSQVALIAPVTLFVTSALFFALFHFPSAAHYFGTTPLYLMVTVGSCYYVTALTAKYTLFDMSKEMAFLSIKQEHRMKAKSVIDSLGSRLGKSGASCLIQGMLIFFGSITGNISLIGGVAVGMIGMSIWATKKLGSSIEHEENLIKASLEHY